MGIKKNDCRGYRTGYGRVGKKELGQSRSNRAISPGKKRGRKGSLYSCLISPAGNGRRDRGDTRGVRGKKQRAR